MPFVRDPRLRLEAAGDDLEVAYTNALGLLTAREAIRAEADSAFAAAEAREMELQLEVDRLRASISASAILRDDMKERHMPPDIISVAAVAADESVSQLAQAEKRLAAAEAERIAAKEEVQKSQSAFAVAADEEANRRREKNSHIAPVVANSCPIYDGIPVQSQTLLVRFKDGPSTDAIQEVLDRYDLTVVGGVPEISLFVLQTGGAVREEETEIEHVLRLNRTVRSLREEPVVFSAVLQTTLARVKPKPVGHTATFSGPCWEWFDANTSGTGSAALINLSDAWQYLNSNGPSARAPVPVTVLDEEFDAHNDLGTPTQLCTGETGVHGNEVLGVLVGASGKTKVNAGDVVQLSECGARPVDMGEFCEREAALTAVIDAFSSLVSSRTPRIVNMSLGYHWIAINKQGKTNSTIQEIVSVQGGIFRDLLAMHKDDVVVVTAAGNDNADDAQWGSPMNWAALGGPAATAAAGPAKNVAAVSAVESNKDVWIFGDVNASLAAPGVDFVVCTSGQSHTVDQGTSLAAPVVSGVAALMIAQNPALKPARTVELLAESAKRTGVVNALDAITFAQRDALHDLADLNGDGVVDWADYVLLRNALRGVPTTLATNKTADLNGDGQVSVSATHQVTGIAGFITDLQVMQTVWDDKNIAAAALDALLTQQ